MTEHVHDIDRQLRARGLVTRVDERRNQIRVKDAELTITVVRRGQYFISILNRLGYDQVFRRKSIEELVRLALARKAVVVENRKRRGKVL